MRSTAPRSKTTRRMPCASASATSAWKLFEPRSRTPYLIYLQPTAPTSRSRCRTVTGRKRLGAFRGLRKAPSGVALNAARPSRGHDEPLARGTYQVVMQNLKLEFRGSFRYANHDALDRALCAAP